MYIPKQFEELDVGVMHELIRAHPLATVVTLSASGLNANHIPMHLSTLGPYGTLQGHVARANPMLCDLAAGTEVLVIFHGPDAYITPSWYATKKETGKVVPTWNYAVVHAYGSMQVVDDVAWLRAHLDTLVNENEAAFAPPWKLSDASPEFTAALIGKIVGIEMVISRLSGKWKASQNQPRQNQLGVVSGLRTSSAAQYHESAMATLVEAGMKNDL